MLPVSVEPGDWQAEERRAELTTVLHSELGKAKAFELVVISPGQLQQWTGKASWNAEEKLPADFFDRLHDGSGCDAVLFSHLRPYRAYRPLVVGWNLKLVKSNTKTILWSVDEVFDASEPRVARAAEDYGRDHVEGTKPMAHMSSILNSPRQFSQFTLGSLLASLPQR